jgi:hypothetical protein
MEEFFYLVEFTPITPIIIKAIDKNLTSDIDSRNQTIPTLAIKAVPKPDQTE